PLARGLRPSAAAPRRPSFCPVAGFPSTPITARARGHPEIERIESTVGRPVVLQGAGDSSGDMFGVPRLESRAATLLKLGDNAVSDAAVEVGLCHDLLSLRVCGSAQRCAATAARWRNRGAS